MAAVSIINLLNYKILLSVFLFLVIIILSFLWVIINQIRISIKGREWGEEDRHIDVEEVESGVEEEAKSDKKFVSKLKSKEIK